MNKTFGYLWLVFAIMSAIYMCALGYSHKRLIFFGHELLISILYFRVNALEENDNEQMSKL